MYDISCSIVTYNTPVGDLKKAIRSFTDCRMNIKLFIIDNSKEDHLRFELSSEKIEYIFPGKNIGYGRAHNLAIKKMIGRSKYHLILNPDVEFDPSIMQTLFSFMEQRPYIGLVMPKVLYRNGEMQHLCKMLPTPFDLSIRRFLPSAMKKLFRKTLDRYELKHNDYNGIMHIPNLSGCFMFVRTEVFFHLGMFDERYFLYMEDTDLCRRINEYFQTIYYPPVSIVHGYSKASYKSVKLMKYHLLSSIKYFNKWGWIFDRRRDLINNSVLTYKTLPKLSFNYKPKEAYENIIQKLVNSYQQNGEITSTSQLITPFRIAEYNETVRLND